VLHCGKQELFRKKSIYHPRQFTNNIEQLLIGIEIDIQGDIIA